MMEFFTRKFIIHVVSRSVRFPYDYASPARNSLQLFSMAFLIPRRARRGLHLAETTTGIFTKRFEISKNLSQPSRTAGGILQLHVRM
ncbi:hypothetical protein PUN28_001021 [Cardiocondyla obscurior]|uniref:Uncharacterized protein n=1 Tax=Cardiocondyla obscurior TaxID=286306 RepID=A0AAW2H2Q5_9HYME